MALPIPELAPRKINNNNAGRLKEYQSTDIFLIVNTSTILSLLYNISIIFKYVKEVAVSPLHVISIGGYYWLVDHW